MLRSPDKHTRHAGAGHNNSALSTQTSAIYPILLVLLRGLLGLALFLFLDRELGLVLVLRSLVLILVRHGYGLSARDSRLEAIVPQPRRGHAPPKVYHNANRRLNTAPPLPKSTYPLIRLRPGQSVPPAFPRKSRMSPFSASLTFAILPLITSPGRGKLG